MNKKYKKLICSIFIVVGVAIAVLCFRCFSFEKNSFFTENLTGEAKPLHFSDECEYCEWGERKIASITGVPDGFVGAYYGHLYYYDEKNAELIEIDCPQGYYSIEDIQHNTGEEEAVWMPTGVFYDEKKDYLYIANYHGHNVLICQLIQNNSTISCEVIREINNDQMVSPENVYVKNGLVAVADYDGNALFVFKDEELLFAREIKLAHGVCIVGENIYVTSLYDRCINKYDLKGTLLKQVGAIGYEGCEAYMWPTSLDAYTNGIIVTDAHTSRIVLLDFDLNYVSSMGGLGPSNNMLNFPYCATVIRNNLYIADVFNQRILVEDSKGAVTKIYGKRINNIQDNVKIDSYNNVPYTYGIADGINSSFFNPYCDSQVVLGYNSIYFIENDGLMQFNLLDSSINASIFGSDVPYIDQFYMTWVKKILFESKEVYVIGSSQTSWEYLIYNATDNVFTISYGVNSNPIWSNNGFWYSEEDADLYLSSVLTELIPYYDAYSILIDQGIDPREAYVSVFREYYNECYSAFLYRPMTEELFRSWIDSFFSSYSGETFLRRYIDGERDIEKAADDYYKSSINGGTTSVAELLFVKMYLRASTRIPD